MASSRKKTKRSRRTPAPKSRPRIRSKRQTRTPAASSRVTLAAERIGDVVEIVYVNKRGQHRVHRSERRRPLYAVDGKQALLIRGLKWERGQIEG